MDYTSIDGTDKAILQILAKDGRISIADLAKRVNLSQTPTVKRMRRLETEGLIQGYRAILNESALGGSITAFIHITVSSHQRATLDAFEALAVDAPEVLDCYMLSGDADFLLRVAVDSLSEFEAFIADTLSNFPHIVSMKSTFTLRRMARKTTPPAISRVKTNE